MGLFDWFNLNSKNIEALVEEAAGIDGSVVVDVRMPEEYRACAEREGVGRAVCDYVAGMTDNYAVRRFEELFIPVHQVLL